MRSAKRVIRYTDIGCITSGATRVRIDWQAYACLSAT